jgi:hypothetical protein
MILPTPEDSACAPVWENYIIAQATQASLGIIPRNALAFGVEVRGYDVTLRCQLREATEEDMTDLDDIASDMAALVGSKIRVTRSYEIQSAPQVSPYGGICWTFIARADSY